MKINLTTLWLGGIGSGLGIGLGMVKIMIKVMVKGRVKIRDGIESRFAAFYLIELKTEHFIRTWKVTFCVTMRGLWT